MNDVRVAADRAVFDILLLIAARGVEGNHDLFAAGGAGICPFVCRAAALLPPLGHVTMLEENRAE